MGEFSRNVRYNKTPGPNQKGFNRIHWQSSMTDSNLDEEDRRLIMAGLFFDGLLTFIRSQKALSGIQLKPSAIARLVVALSTFNLLSIAHKTMPKAPSPETSRVVTSDLVELTVTLPTGEIFSPDELITGMGDGMKHILRELQTMDRPNGKPSEYESEESHFKQIWREFNMAICYQTAVEFWLHCLGSGYVLAKHDKGLALVPFDRPAEIARTVSAYRRSTMSLHENMAFVDQWFHSFPPMPRPLKEKLCAIPLVSSVSGLDRIDHIELGLGKKVLDSAAKEIAGQVWLKTSYYKDFLDDLLPGLYGFTINQITNGWRLLQSLANVIFTDLRTINDGGLGNLLRYAPRIPKRVLCGTFARALAISPERAEMLAKVFAFDASQSKDLWAQPLVECEEDYCLVIPCILSVHLFRIVESWMRQGGIDLDRRGPEFELFCRGGLKEVLVQSPLRNSVEICDDSVSFKPQGEREEEIDIVIIFADTLLLIETKCILWPDEALQFANYREVVEKAVAQVARKADAVSRNYSAFAERLVQYGYRAPEKANVLCCVLSNSAVFSGFPINGIPIIDLSILNSFLRNEHIRFLERDKGKTLNKQATKFYAEAADATKVLGDYLLDPPQLSHMRRSIKTREIVFPIENPEYGKLIYETYTVELDVTAYIKDQSGSTVQ